MTCAQTGQRVTLARCDLNAAQHDFRGQAQLRIVGGGFLDVVVQRTLAVDQQR
jgi:hypothetical protein